MHNNAEIFFWNNRNGNTNHPLSSGRRNEESASTANVVHVEMTAGSGHANWREAVVMMRMEAESRAGSQWMDSAVRAVACLRSWMLIY